MKNNNNNSLHKIVVIGGGAGGLELVTQLGKSLGKKQLANITLIDAALTHIWKPLLHEVAAGSLNSHDDEISYLAHAHWHHYKFRLGKVDKIDREKRIVSTAPTLDENGEEYIPRRYFPYDTLIIAVGSITNDFNVEGVKEHCYFLDRRKDADKFHQHLLKSAYTAHTQEGPLREGQLHIAIAGAGATGIELSAELHGAARQIVKFGLDRIDPDKDIKITILEAAEKILPALPARLTDQVAKQLASLNIELLTEKRIIKATADGFYAVDGDFIPAEIKVWAAGIKAPDFLKDITDLETNNSNQLVVKRTLQTTNDKNIFAFGDCAACPMPDTDQNVPPRAQAAHQQASMLFRSIKRQLVNKELPEYTYVDYGSLINLSRYSTVGNLMGNLAGKISSDVFIEGLIARFVYIFLYKLHQLAVHGLVRVGLLTIANLLTRKMKPRMKLH